MYELILVALIWPQQCEAIGSIYHDAARVRDQGLPLEAVVKMTRHRRLHRALWHVYERPDMTPEQWRWLAVGVCVGGDGGRLDLGRMI